jgi:hypothetical protein
MCEHYAGIGSIAAGVSRISLRLVLQAVAALDSAGGASVGLAAWDLCVEEHELVDAWQRAIADGLLKPSGHHEPNGEQVWRLTAGGWAALEDDHLDTA